MIGIIYFSSSWSGFLETVAVGVVFLVLVVVVAVLEEVVTAPMIGGLSLSLVKAPRISMAVLSPNVG